MVGCQFDSDCFDDENVTRKGFLDGGCCQLIG
jgi:hypothetical protein